MSHDDDDVDLAALQAKRRQIQSAPRAASRDDPDVDDDDRLRSSAASSSTAAPRRSLANSITAPAGNSF
jgi:hypothetical protein